MKLFGPKCPRCEERNEKDAEYCEHCGISMAAPRPAILKGNRWEAAPDEFAVFFKGRDLKGLFSKTLYIPAGMRAWILQDNRVEEIMEGEYTLQTLPERLNALFADKHTEILVTRGAAVAIPFRFDDIPSAELLQVTVETNIFVKLGELAAFRNHFMLRPGAVNVPQLRELLNGSVRQILVETLGGRRLEEMTGTGGLRQEIDRKLQAGLQHRFKDFGLAFDQADTLCIRHDRFDASRRLKGSLWLEYDEKRQKAEHQKSLEDLYSQDEWGKIRAREEDLRRRYRTAELTQEEAEFAHVIRLRELALFEKVTQSNTREQAITLGARDEIEALEHQYQAQRRLREKEILGNAWQDEEADIAWQRTQEIARIRHESAIKIEESRREEAESLERKRIANGLERIRIEGEIERVRLIEDETERKQQLATHAELLMKAGLREQDLLDARHQLAIDEIEVARQTQKRESARIQQWEDILLEEKIENVRLRTATAKSDQGLSTLQKMMQEKESYDLAQIRIDLEQTKADLLKRREEQALSDLADENALERELKKQKVDREAALEARAHEREMLQIKGSLPAEALIAATENPQAMAAILDLAKTKTLVTTSPDHIRAILSATNKEYVHGVTEGFTVQQAATASGDALSEAIRKLNDDMRTEHERMIGVLTRGNELAQGNLVEMGRLIKDAAIGVANGQSNQSTRVPEHTLPRPQYSGAGDSIGSQAKYIKCPNSACDQFILDGLAFCGHCGTKLHP